MSDAFFEYIAPASGTASEPTGLWAARAPAVSFEAGAALADDAPVWRVNLSADPRAAEQTFRQAERRLVAAQQALESVPERLENYARGAQMRGEGQVSFAAPEQGTPEADLTGLLDDFRAVESGQVSFGVREEAGQAWEQARAGFETLMQSINREVLHFAWVETKVEDDLLARTTVGWSGESQTLYSADITPAQIAQHSRTLYLASASRALKLRMFTTITTGAVKLTSLLATPGGAVLALPMAYKFVTQIMAQVQEYQALQ